MQPYELLWCIWSFIGFLTGLCSIFLCIFKLPNNRKEIK